MTKRISMDYAEYEKEKRDLKRDNDHKAFEKGVEHVFDGIYHELMGSRDFSWVIDGQWRKIINVIINNRIILKESLDKQ